MTGRGPVGVAIVGAGVISRQYLASLTGFPDLRVHVVADLSAGAAADRAAEFGISTHGPVATALGHPDVELVVNLTTPAAHVDVGLLAIAAGKHLWNEKPLATDRAGAASLLTAAAAAGVRIGGAPDTFLGQGLQTAFRAIDAGGIGTPRTAVFMMQSPGAEAWHPNPAFLYAPGAGPLFDMGPYYLTALTQVFGSVVEVAAIGGRARERRTIATGERAGEMFDVHVPTHVGMLLRFADGRSAQGVLSVESPLKRSGFCEVTGTAATIAIPDPNTFEGEVGIWRSGAAGWDTTVVETSRARRGLGVLEMARAIRHDLPHRATGELAYHVLDTLCAVDEAVTSGGYVPVDSRIAPAPCLPTDWDPHASML